MRSKQHRQFCKLVESVPLTCDASLVEGSLSLKAM